MELARAIDAIPVVATTAERAGKYPNPAVNQRVHNLATGNIDRWNGTAWVSTPLATTDPLEVGALTVTGNTTLGDATTDTVTVTARVASDVVPSTANTRDLGTSALPFAEAYVGQLFVGVTSQAQQVVQTTDTVGPATVILNASAGSYAYFCVVTGRETASGNDEFLDLVAFASNASSAAVLSSGTLEGSPAARTYSMSTGNLRVAMAANTYHIGVYAFRIPRS